MLFINSYLLLDKEKKILFKLTKDVCKRYSIILPDELEISKRLKATDAYYQILEYRFIGEKYRIALAYNHYIQFGFDSFVKILKHELAHHIQYIKHDDFSHSIGFKNICLKLGGSLNEDMATGKYLPCLSENFIETKWKYYYKCPNCLHYFKTKKLLDTKFHCAQCAYSVKDFIFKRL